MFVLWNTVVCFIVQQYFVNMFVLDPVLYDVVFFFNAFYIRCYGCLRSLDHRLYRIRCYVCLRRLHRRWLHIKENLSDYFLSGCSSQERATRTGQRICFINVKIVWPAKLPKYQRVGTQHFAMKQSVMFYKSRSFDSYSVVRFRSYYTN